jgi:hypothetical protein
MVHHSRAESKEKNRNFLFMGRQVPGPTGISACNAGVRDAQLSGITLAIDGLGFPPKADAGVRHSQFNANLS